MYKKALIPTDGSESSKKEISKILNVLDENDGEIIILSVAEKVVTHHFQRKADVKKLNDVLIEEAKENTEEMKERISGDNIKVTTRVESGSPAEKILEVSEEEDIDLIVIARSGRSNLNRFFLGSVAEKVVENAKKDVLLIN